MWAQTINIILGLLIMTAPSIWQYDTAALNNNYICGPLIVCFSLVALTEAARNVRFLNIPVAAWLIVAPFFIPFDSTGLLINLLAAILVIILSLIKGRMKYRFGGGWRSLIQNNPEHMKAANGIESGTVNDRDN